MTAWRPPDLLERARGETSSPTTSSGAGARSSCARAGRCSKDALSELRASDALTAETLLERRPTVLSELEDGALVFEGKRIRVPERAVAELRAVAESDGPFRADELPGELDAESRLVLLRRLIREGFVRRSAVDG